MSLSNSILESVIVLGNFIDGVGHVNITQKYLNTNPNPAESTYIFELDSKSVINTFNMLVGEKLINGLVKEKTVASKEYSDAKEQGKKTSLLTKLSDTSYRVQIAGVNPNEQITISYSYVTTLDQDDLARYKFSLPTNIAPKYTGSSSQTVADSIFGKVMNTIRYTSTSTGYDFSLELRFMSGNRIKGVESLTNKIDVEIVDANKLIVRSKTIPSQGDFNLFVSTDISPAIYKWITSEINTNNLDTYYLITHKIPDETINTTQPKNYYFFLDRSGSMQGEKITQAKNALVKFIEQIDVNSFFNVYSFGSNFVKLTPNLMQAANLHKGYACKLIESFKSDMGGTEIYPCLEDAFNDTTNCNQFEKIFVFLTDGQVSNVNSITNLIKSNKTRSNVRIFSIGIGSDVDRNLVRMMADETAGECKFITDIKDLSLSIQSILTLVNKQYYSNVRLSEKSDQIVYPSIYPGRTYNWVGKNLTDLVINGTNPIDGSIKSWDLATIPVASYSDILISQLYANVLIRYLDLLPRTPELVNQIIKLSVDYQIMSSHTSYILVDSDITVDTTKLIQTSVPHYSDEKELGSRTTQTTRTDKKGGGSALRFMKSYAAAAPPPPSSNEEDCEEGLSGGMDMFGGHKGGSYTKQVPKYNTTINLSKLVQTQLVDGSFEITWQDLMYQSQPDYTNRIAISKIDITNTKLYNNIIMYGYLDSNPTYTTSFEKLCNWFVRFYPDIELDELKKIYSIHMEYIKLCENQTISIVCHADY